jgi:hypothetical protein
MATAELELVEEEVEEVEPEIIEPLTKTKAKALDKKIRNANSRVNDNIEKTQDSYDALVDLLSEAEQGQIHMALDYKSWTAYIQDTVQINVNDRAERKSLVTLMSGKGMPQRAIAAVLNKSQKTIDRDLDGAEFDTDTVTSVTGAEVPRNKPTVVEEEPEPAQPMTAAQLVDEFSNEDANLHNATAALQEIMLEEKWPGARKRVTKANLNDLQEIIAALTAIVDDLMAV